MKKSAETIIEIQSQTAAPPGLLATSFCALKYANHEPATATIHKMNPHM